jgi:uncharacterized protein YndB with AHSA1/START domain
MPDQNESLIPEQIERELLLPAPPAEVWNIVTRSGWLAQEVSLDLVPGGDASFSSEESLKSGWVEEAVAPGRADGSTGRLAFWWSLDGEPATRVELTLEPEGEQGTRLRVVEARPLDLLDVAGVPLPGAGNASDGPVMLVAA